MVANNGNGVHVLLKEHPSIPDGPVEFLRFVVNGEQVEITKYIDSDLLWERTYGRHMARHIWRTARTNGFRRD